MDKRVIPTSAQEYVATLLQNKVAEPLSEDALKELARLYSLLTEGLNALDAFDLSRVEPAVGFVMAEADRNEG